MPGKNIKKSGHLGLIVVVPLLLLLGLSAELAGRVQAQDETPTPTVLLDNLIRNGDFEDGFYPVPELGFEPPDIGNIPFEWSWFRNQAYGKYDIDNNENFALECPENVFPYSFSNNALSVYMQSTDQPDARLGVYQTVDVVPGQEYRFTISGTIQAQQGAQGHEVELVFDHTGGSDWRAIPHERWTLLPWTEQELEFDISGPDDPDLATVEAYSTTVKARSNKLTIFLSAWRLWANWRSTVYTFDCVSLVPMSQIIAAAAAVTPTTTSTAQEAAMTGPAAVPPEIPDSGGILETKGNALLLAGTSVMIILGLVGAGIWNIRRQKQK